MRGFGRITLVAAAALAVAFFSAPGPAAACDFPAYPPPQEALEEATAVFSGEVVSIDPVDDDPGEQYIAATFAVDRAWKGVESSPVIVETHQDEGVCGFPFEVGETYIVYAHSNGSPLTTALYHRTQLLERAGEDLDALGEGTEIAPQAENGATDDDDEFNLGILVLAVVIISIITATIMLLRQSKPGLPDNYDDIEAGEDDPAGDQR
jgi:hypothetical protein